MPSKEEQVVLLLQDLQDEDVCETCKRYNTDECNRCMRYPELELGDYYEVTDAIIQ